MILLQNRRTERWSARTGGTRKGTPPAVGGRRAAAAIEFAVVGLVFFPLVLGIIEIGRGMMTVHVLTAAAARGCRTAVLEGNGKTQVESAVSDALTKAGITGQTTTIYVNNSVADPASANAGDEITVNVSVPVSQITWVPGANYLKGNIVAQYTLTKE
jgi:Flp pilus assembly protein TadG